MDIIMMVGIVIAGVALILFAMSRKGRFGASAQADAKAATDILHSKVDALHDDVKNVRKAIEDKIK